MNKIINLLKVKRFLPLFVTQFLGAFNDNVYKNALVILITYQFASDAHLNASLLITIAAGIFILPFLLFSATAGQLADKFEKATLIRYTKVAEILLMVIAAVGFYTHAITLLMLVLFLLGTQAAFFGPLKYSILPDHLRADELIAGNALLESGTFLAILLGTILGGLLTSFSNCTFIISIILLCIATFGFIASYKIPPATIGAKHLKIRWNIFQESWDIVTHAFKQENLRLAIYAISWFWLIGGTYLSQFPTYVKDALHAQSGIVTLFLSAFTAGIGVGSLLCNRLLKGRIDATYVPLAALGMTLFGLDLVLASRIHFDLDHDLISLGEFLVHFNSWRILFDLFFLAICGGVYIVPLYAMLQHESSPSHRSRVIAANNIVNALFMVVAAVLTSLMLFLHMTVTEVFFIIAIANLIVACYICQLLPEALIKSCLTWIFKTLYRVEVIGLENLTKARKSVLMIPNHTSFLDAALLATFLPDRLTFAINTQVAKKWWMKLLLKLVNTYAIDPTKPLATKSLIEFLKDNHQVVIFPEGRITVTGSLMKIYEGPGLIAHKAGADLLPIRIDGAQYTPFSYLRGKVNIRMCPKITITLLEPRTFKHPETDSKREQRRAISAELYDIMTESQFFSSNLKQTVFQSLLAAAKIHGKHHIVLEDIERVPMSYQRLVLSSFILGRYLSQLTQQNENIGVLLPNSIANVVTFFAMSAFHRVPAMLNVSAGMQNLLSACHTAAIKTVITSQRFVHLAKLQATIDAMKAEHIQILYLEDIKANITFIQKIFVKLMTVCPSFYYYSVNKITKKNIDNYTASPAVILFTSGSEGLPKGVALSHENLQSNRYQLSSRVDFNSTDKILNALPMFHSFGLNSATLLPILSGLSVFMYPSPLHYKIVPELCYDTNATILFGTDTFLANYAKYAHPYNFYSIRYIFAGAEKLREETSRLWMQKFGIRIFEGYGATEASPVIATNTPMQCKMGTVGRILPGMRYELKPVEGLQTGGKLFMSGPNIMMGYLLAKTPGKIIPPEHGWHDTGDIVEIDHEGYLVIIGRAKRFAKIAGEMVSLAAIEEQLHHLWPNYQHALLTMPDQKKGEQIILFTNFQNADLSTLINFFKTKGLAEISLPRKINILTQLPLLGSGKIDYQTLKESLVSL